MKDSSLIFWAVGALALVLWNRHLDGTNGVARKSLGTATPGLLNGGVATAQGGGEAALPAAAFAPGERAPVLLGIEGPSDEKTMTSDPVSTVTATMDEGHPLSWV